MTAGGTISRMTVLDRLLAIVHSLAFEENGRMSITAALWEQENVRLRFEVHDGNDDFTKWELVFRDVLEVQLSQASHCGLNVWRSDHVAIDQYTDRRAALAFSSPATDPDRLLGQLWAAHRAIAGDWIPFDRYLNTAGRIEDLVRAPSGKLASGPLFLIDAYAEVLKRNGCVPSRAGRTRKGPAESACMVHFDESYVVAKSVRAKQL
jgi:hypothetical protein